MLFFHFFLNDSNVGFFQIVVRSAMIQDVFGCLHEQIRGTVKAEKKKRRMLEMEEKRKTSEKICGGL